MIYEAEEQLRDENSKRTRIDPTCEWLRDHGGANWPARLVDLAHGLDVRPWPGAVISVEYQPERRVPASAARLAWMIRNADRLTPRDGSQWSAYRKRVIENPLRNDALEKLYGDSSNAVDGSLRLEGDTSADCFIECEHAIIWLEGKRNDSLASGTTWDVTRDQLARNVEAAWLVARSLDKDFCVIVCHEFRLKHHESLLIEGYRRGTWTGGWPHLTPEERIHLGARIGTLTWLELVAEWAPLGPLLDLPGA